MAESSVPMRPGELDGSGVEQQLLGQGRLAGVGVGDDGKRPAPGNLRARTSASPTGRSVVRGHRAHSFGVVIASSAGSARGPLSAPRLIAALPADSPGVQAWFLHVRLVVAALVGSAFHCFAIGSCCVSARTVSILSR